MLCLIQADFLKQKEISRAVGSEATGVRGHQLRIIYMWKAALMTDSKALPASCPLPLSCTQSFLFFHREHGNYHVLQSPSPLYSHLHLPLLFPFPLQALLTGPYPFFILHYMLNDSRTQKGQSLRGAYSHVPYCFILIAIICNGCPDTSSKDEETDSERLGNSAKITLQR